LQGHSRSWGGFVLVLALGAALLGACKGATPEDQTRSAGVISTVLSSRPGAPHGVAMEVNFNQSRFTSYYRVWYRLSEIAQGDNASKAFKVKTSGSNCGVFGGEPSPFNNSKPEDLRHDDDYSPGYFLIGRSPDNADAAWADFAWYHPHPPCGNTPDHKDATISITISNPSGSFTCTYVGAATGKGECKDNK